MVQLTTAATVTNMSLPETKLRKRHECPWSHGFTCVECKEKWNVGTVHFMPNPKEKSAYCEPCWEKVGTLCLLSQ
jgi:hypothetical protein